MRGYRLHDQVIFRQLGGETILVQLDSNEIFRLNETGARVWEVLSKQHDLAAIVTLVAEEYDVEPEELTRELEALIASLVGAGILIAGEDG